MPVAIAATVAMLQGATIIPAVGNQTLGMLKDTSLVSVLAISDILRVGNEYATKHFNYFQTYTYIALTYLALTLIMSRFVLYLEKRNAPGILEPTTHPQ